MTTISIDTPYTFTYAIQTLMRNILEKTCQKHLPFTDCDTFVEAVFKSFIAEGADIIKQLVAIKQNANHDIFKDHQCKQALQQNWFLFINQCINFGRATPASNGIFTDDDQLTHEDPKGVDFTKCFDNFLYKEILDIRGIPTKGPGLANAIKIRHDLAKLIIQHFVQPTFTNQLISLKDLVEHNDYLLKENLELKRSTLEPAPKPAPKRHKPNGDSEDSQPNGDSEDSQPNGDSDAFVPAAAAFAAAAFAAAAEAAEEAAAEEAFEAVSEALGLREATKAAAMAGGAAMAAAQKAHSKMVAAQEAQEEVARGADGEARASSEVRPEGTSSDLSRERVVDTNPTSSYKDQMKMLWNFEKKGGCLRKTYDVELAEAMACTTSFWTLSFQQLDDKMPTFGKDCKVQMGVSTANWLGNPQPDKSRVAYVDFADNMAEYIKPNYTVMIASPVMERRDTGRDPSGASVATHRSRHTTSQEPPRVLAYYDTVHYVGADQQDLGAVSRVPLLFLYGLQARPGGPPSAESEGGVFGGVPKVHPAEPTAVVCMQTSGGYAPTFSQHLVDPDCLVKVDASNACQELRELVKNVGVATATRNNLSEVMTTEVKIPLADPDLMGACLPFLAPEDCAPCVTQPNQPTTAKL